MRKAVLSVLVSLLALSLNASGFIGVSIAPDWYWDSSGSGSADLLFTADGANYFGIDHGAGIEYGLGVLFPLDAWGDMITTSVAGSPYGFVFRAGLGYRYDTEGIVGIFAGAGIRGTLQMVGDLRFTDQDLRLFTLDAYGRAGVDFDIMGIMSINAGLMAGGPVYSSIAAIGGGVSAPSGYTMSGFFIAPFAGVSLIY